jgi:uncharacterized membrane-anchored protein
MGASSAALAVTTDREAEFINKLPKITAAFWVMKITATTLGETAGDWASMTLDLGYLISTLIFFGIFVVALGSQLTTRRHIPFLYWTVIIATSTAGTTMSDYMDRSLELGYTKGASILVTILLVTLALWRLATGSLSVTNVKDRKGEIFYWLAILFSNTLGTASGDFLSDDSGLGFLGSWLLVTGLLGVVLAAFYLTKLPRVLLFWLAFILTRPFGATFGDLLTKSHAKGGFDLGRGWTSLLLLGILIVTIMISYRKTGSAVLESTDPADRPSYAKT